MFLLSLTKCHGVPCSCRQELQQKSWKTDFSSRPRPRPNVRDQDFMIQDQDFHFCPRGASRPRPWSRGLHHCNIDPHKTHKQTHRQDWLQYTAPLSLAGSVEIYVDEQQVSQFRYLGISEDRYCTKVIRIRIAMRKKVLMEKKKLFAGKMNLELKKRIMKCLVWSV